MRYNGHGLIWDIARSPHVPGGLLDAENLPARMLWQAEVMIWAAARVEVIAKQQAELDARTAAANARIRSRHV